jgi:hypothetical protein
MFVLCVYADTSCVVLSCVVLSSVSVLSVQYDCCIVVLWVVGSGDDVTTRQRKNRYNTTVLYCTVRTGTNHSTVQYSRRKKISLLGFLCFASKNASSKVVRNMGLIWSRTDGRTTVQYCTVQALLNLSCDFLMRFCWHHQSSIIVILYYQLYPTVFAIRKVIHSTALHCTATQLHSTALRLNSSKKCHLQLQLQLQ